MGEHADQASAEAVDSYWDMIDEPEDEFEAFHQEANMLNAGSLVPPCYIDGSTGFKRGEQAGYAIYWNGTLIAVPGKQKQGANGAEMLAFKLALEKIKIRPLVIITDSAHVVSHASKYLDVKVVWKKRNSCPEQMLVDTASKLAARSGKRYQLTVSNVIATDKELFKKLRYYEENEWIDRQH